MTLQDWQDHVTSKGVGQNDAVRMLNDAKEEIERLRAALAGLIFLTDEILDVDGAIAQALPPVHYPMELLTDEQCTRLNTARRVLGEVEV